VADRILTDSSNSAFAPWKIGEALTNFPQPTHHGCISGVNGSLTIWECFGTSSLTALQFNVRQDDVFESVVKPQIGRHTAGLGCLAVSLHIGLNGTWVICPAQSLNMHVTPDIVAQFNAQEMIERFHKFLTNTQSLRLHRHFEAATCR
jgi:hypothetical protein